MPKRSSNEVSSPDYRESKRVSITPVTIQTPVLVPVHGLNENSFSDKCCSSVGSNYPILDDDNDVEVESAPSKIDTCLDDQDLFVDGLRIKKSDIAGLHFPDVGWTKEDEVMSWIEKYGDMILDHNGFLLGEFSRLDQELSIV